jgi:hypothetical protein
LQARGERAIERPGQTTLSMNIFIPVSARPSNVSPTGGHFPFIQLHAQVEIVDRAANSPFG